ncbi:MAG: DUF2007 domain-containing protein [Deltaproteobacteria bacterium]|nr:DUF2007 domain-containing protein [Deltaproteobacteria bacterium]
MYCPKCKAEYRDGFFECADCHVPLVENLPPEEPEPMKGEYIPEFVGLEEVMTSFDIGEISVVRSLLDDNQISYLVQNENFSSFYGSVPARILVPKDRMDEARDLLQDFL